MEISVYSEKDAEYQYLLLWLSYTKEQLDVFADSVRILESNDSSILSSLYAAQRIDQDTFMKHICPLFRHIFRFWSQLREGTLSEGDVNFKPHSGIDRGLFYTVSDQQLKTLLCIPYLNYVSEKHRQWLQKEAKVKILV